jgi:monoamine oxidase
MNIFSKFALPIILTSLLTPVASATNTTHDVIVVGAGSAGLYATKNLINDGYDVLIIEATDRIGGRVYSKTLGDMRVQMGAEEHYDATVVTQYFLLLQVNTVPVFMARLTQTPKYFQWIIVPIPVGLSPVQ